MKIIIKYLLHQLKIFYLNLWYKIFIDIDIILIL